MPITPEQPITPSRSIETGFIFADSHIRRLQRSELRRLNSPQLRIARNEIFARKGRYFKSSDLKRHFGQFSWYQPHTWNPRLNSTENANVKLIKSEEGRR